MRPLHDDPSKYVMYDFKPAFPPYTKESVKELLLIRELESDGIDEQQQIGDNETEAPNDNGSGDASSLDAEQKGDEDTVQETRPVDDMSAEKEEENLAAPEANDSIIEPDEIARVDEVASKVETEDAIEVTSIDEEDEDPTISDEKSTMVSEEATETEQETMESPEGQQSEEAVVESESKLVDTADESMNESDDADVSNKKDDETEIPTGDVYNDELEEDIAHEYSYEDLASADPQSGPGIKSEEKDESDPEQSAVETPNHGINDASLEDEDTSTDEDGENLSSESKPAEEENVVQTDIDIQSSSDDITSQNDPFEDSTSNIEPIEGEPTEEDKTDKITITYDESPPVSNLNKDEDANREFVTGLDEIDKFFESVSPPDELDVGADGSSMQDVLVGQGLKIIFKRAKSIGLNVKQRFEKIVEKALPQQLVNLAGNHEEDEEESLEDILKILKSDAPLKAEQQNKDKKKESSSTGDVGGDRLENRFPLLKKPRVNKIYKYARRKWQQAKHLFDDFLSIFGGDEDEDEFDFNSMNFGDVKSMVEQNRFGLKEGEERPKFGSEVDDSFLKSRHDAMMKLREQKKDNVGVS